MGCSTHQTALQGQPQANKPLQCRHPHTKPPEAQPEEEKLQCRHSPEWKPVAAGQFHFPISGPRCSDTTRATSWWVCDTRRAVGRQTCSWEGLGEGGRHRGEGWAHRVHHVAGGDHPAVAGGGVCCGWQGVAGSPEGLHRRPEPTGQNLLQHRLHPPGAGAAGRGRGGKAQLPMLRGHVAQFSLQMFPSRSSCPAPCRRSPRASAVTSTWLWPTSSGETSSTRDTSECMASVLPPRSAGGSWLSSRGQCGGPRTQP